MPSPSKLPREVLLPVSTVLVPCVRRLCMLDTTTIVYCCMTWELVKNDAQTLNNAMECITYNEE